MIVVLLLERNNFQWDIQLLAHRPDIAKVFLPGALTQKVQFIFKPDLQIECSDVMLTLSGKHAQDHGAVDSTRNEGCDFNTIPLPASARLCLKINQREISKLF
jgi:hypothetical protein